MRIGLNLLHALPEVGGVWNYIRGLIKAIAEVDRTDSFIVFANRESEKLVPVRPNFDLLRVPIDAADRTRRVFYEHTSLLGLARKYKLDCLHWFSGTQAVINAVPAAVTIYDLNSFLNLAPYSWSKRAYLKAMVSQTARRARLLLPMSRATADALVRMFKVSPARLAVIPPVLGPEFRPMSGQSVSAFRAQYGLPERYWLYAAHFYPHKNHLRLLEAYFALKLRVPSSWPLVLRGDARGAEEKVLQFIKERGMESEVIFLPSLEDCQLPVLYSASSALVFPSLYEGGGLPIVEAMACGLPIAAAGIPPVREFAGPAASYFNPYDVESIVTAMKTFQTHPELPEYLRAKALSRAEEFRPHRVIPKLQASYARITSHK